MDKKSQIFLILILLSLIVSIAYTFYRTIIITDYELTEETELVEETEELEEDIAEPESKIIEEVL